MAESLDERLEAGASEALDYMLLALRTGTFDAELLKTAQFLLEVHLAHNHDHDVEEEEDYVFTSEDDLDEEEE
jgi:hypothetical protein